jgi:hypothetical protein
MSLNTEPLKVLIERDQAERLEGEAAARGTSVAALVREAIDLAFPASGSRRAAAGAILSAAPMDVPDVDELRLELDRVHFRDGSSGLA